jgi:hypothetical protein
VKEQLAAIGIGIDIVHSQDLYQAAGGDPDFPRLKIPMFIGRWSKDYPSASTFVPPLFGSENIDGGTLNNRSLVGASQAVLQGYGYEGPAIPGVDDRIAECATRVFADQVRCWSDLDQYLTTQIVPWIPLLSDQTVAVVSSRVRDADFDQSIYLPRLALDNIALSPDADSSPSPSPSGSPTPSAAVPAIPGGVYQTTISKQDILRFDPHADPQGLDEGTGTFTIFLRDGMYRFVQDADHPIFDPLSVGRYYGSGDQVVFEGIASSGGTILTPPMRWTFDGASLHFTFLSCEGLDDPENPAFCDDTKVLYEAHPWVKVG